MVIFGLDPPLNTKKGGGEEALADNRSAYLVMGHTAQILGVKAHQVRSMSASWALLGGVSVGEIMGACNWRSHNTFTQFYLQPLSWSNGGGLHSGTFCFFPTCYRTKQEFRQ